jgi:COP9 signalosome complex subunit 1
MDWVESARDAERKEGSRLDVELRGYMSNLIKESIRVGHFLLALIAGLADV